MAQADNQGHSTVASVFRGSTSVDTLTRVHNVTGQEFPVSGNAWLRYRKLQLKLALNAEAARIGREIYKDTDSMGER